MSQKSYLWTTGGAGDGASTYTRADWARIAEILAACSGFEGVAPGYLNELEATDGGANTVNINTGGAVVDGKPYLNDASEAVNIPSAVGGGNTRIDRIVLRADWTAQTVRIVRIAGTDAGSPTPPAITQNPGTTYDVPLCQVLVNTSGAVTITEDGEKVWAAPHVDDATIEVEGITGALQVKDNAIDDTKVGNRVPQFYRRQGGSSTNWGTQGTTNYTPGAVREQVGVKQVSLGPSDYAIAEAVTFPTTFSQVPHVTLTMTNLGSVDDGHTAMVWVTNVTTNGFTINYRRSHTSASSAIGCDVNWRAVGQE